MTTKQQIAASKVVEFHGNIGKAMVAAGYTPASAKNPKNLTQAKGWKELLETYLPDNKLLRKHEEALEATKWNDFTGEREEDHMVRLKAVDMGYKLKGKINTGISVTGEKVVAILGGITNVSSNDSNQETPTT